MTGFATTNKLSSSAEATSEQLSLEMAHEHWQ